jgi:WhiB family transcriptional regulator, redox-sensing transcriptional regulator
MVAPALACRQPAMPPVVSSPGSLAWMSRGACQRADPELFFPIATTGPALQQISAAKAVCGRCSVRASCLSYALETLQEGIWGGTTSDERRPMHRRSGWRSSAR